MWWRRGGLSARQRILAAVLTALVIAAATYRLVVFGDFNRIHGGGASTSVTITGESEYLRPNIAEVDQSARSNARTEGKLRHLSCQEVPGDTWSCTLQFVGGATVVYRGVWDATRGTVAWSAVERKMTLHVTVPLRQ